MAELPSWEDLRDGKDCPFDVPRTGLSEFMHLVRKMSVSTLYLSREQAYRGASALIFDPRHVVRIDELALAEWTRLATDLWIAERALHRVFSPDHVNIECLGMTVPHLHWHIIPRYRDDGRFGGPIWTSKREDMPSKRLTERESAVLAADIDAAIDDLIPPRDGP